MKLSTKIKLEHWQAVTTGVTHDTLEAMLTKAIDKMEEEIKNNPSCKGILDDSAQ